MFYKFSKSATPEPPTDTTTAIYHKLKAGEKLDKEETERLNYFLHNGYNMATYKRAGWAFDFRPFLKRFLVNFEHLNWQCIYATNKTAIRKSDAHKSWIIEIHEIPNKQKD